MFHPQLSWVKNVFVPFCLFLFSFFFQKAEPVLRPHRRLWQKSNMSCASVNTIRWSTETKEVRIIFQSMTVLIPVYFSHYDVMCSFPGCLRMLRHNPQVLPIATLSLHFCLFSALVIDVPRASLHSLLIHSPRITPPLSRHLASCYKIHSHKLSCRPLPSLTPPRCQHRPRSVTYHYLARPLRPVAPSLL